MLNVREEVKQKYLSDEYRGNFQFTIGTDSYDSTNIKSGSIELIESLYSGESLDFSAVEKGSLKFTLGNIDQSISDLLNKKIIFNQLVEYASGGSSSSSNISVVGNKLVMYSPITTNLSVTDTILEFSEAGEQTSYDVAVDSNKLEITQSQGIETVPLGVYTVVESKRASDYFVDVTAYDNLYLFDKNVTEWWESLTFPITIRNLLISLCTYCDATYSFPLTFTNSTFEVNKNASFENVKGTEILGYIQQICACFIKADRNGQIIMINLPTGDWSSATPVVTYGVHEIVSNLVIADYETATITGVIARATPDDVGVYVGDTSNAYVIENNPLLYGITSTQSGILTNIFNKISNILFTPVSGVVKGACFVECGDLIKIQSFKGATAIVPITYRRLHSNGLMRDEIKVRGTEKQTVVRTLDSSIKALNQKTHVLVNDVEQLRSEIDEIDTSIRTPQYYLSISDEELLDDYIYPSLNTFPTQKTYPVIPWEGDWQFEVPTLTVGHYLWTRFKVDWASGSPEYTEPMLDGYGEQIIANRKEWESDLIQLVDQISTKVGYTEYDENNNIILQQFNTIIQNIDGISTEVSKKVGDDEIISKINQSAEQIKINANKISLVGDVYFYSSDSESESQPRIRVYKGSLSTLDSEGNVGFKIWGDVIDLYSWAEPGVNIGAIVIGDAGAGQSKSLQLIVKENNNFFLRHDKTINDEETIRSVITYVGSSYDLSFGGSNTKLHNITAYSSNNITLNGGGEVSLNVDTRHIRLGSGTGIFMNNTTTTNKDSYVWIKDDGGLQFGMDGKSYSPYYRAGNGFTTTSYMIASGDITSSNKIIRIICSVPANMANVTPNLVSLTGVFRGIDGYVNSQSSGINWASQSGITTAVEKCSDFHLLITLSNSSAYTNVTNNTPITFRGVISISFS